MDADIVVEPFALAPADAPAVRGVLHRPRAAGGDGLVLTHGAGSDCEAPLLVALATALAGRGLVVLRCDLPFRQARRRGPPAPSGASRDREGLRAAVLALRSMATGRIFLGGQSYGGRQASMLASGSAGLATALLLLSYPLHAPGRPAAPRTAHFAALGSPVLFVHGTADPFGSVEEMEAARALIPAPTALLVVEGAGHDLDVRRGVGASPVAERIAEAWLTFVG